MNKLTLLLSAVILAACSTPQPGADKTQGGVIVGSAWGAGTGAIIGNQLSLAGEGAAVGAGLGLVAGALGGGTHDYNERAMLKQQEAIGAVHAQNEANADQLAAIQSKLDQSIAAGSVVSGGVFQVFFDTDASSLRSGSVANLQIIADSLKASPFAYVINVVGHTDDSGTPEYNQKLSEARARTVSAYIAERGVSLDRLQVKSFGSTRPIASNTTEVGRQLNNRVDLYIGRQ